MWSQKKGASTPLLECSWCTAQRVAVMDRGEAPQPFLLPQWHRQGICLEEARRFRCLSKLTVLQTLKGQNACSRSSEFDHKGVGLTQHDYKQLLQVRLAVGYLGERSQHAWWPTAFFEGASASFLEPVFVKTSRLAQYHGVLEAARRVHDEHLNVGSYHLFRLPEEVEQDLYSIVRMLTAEDGASLVPRTKEAAEAVLLRAKHPTTGSVGPIAVGDVANVSAPRTLNEIAALYGAAFQKGDRVYPYLVGGR